MHLTCLSVPQCWRWLMIVSRQMALLPVFWSPMISSRWPRPMLVIASMALMPVSSGSLTGWRLTTEGACSSRARVVSGSMSPLPSSGRPSGSTTRPRKPSPTGTESTRPVCLTSSPSSMPEASPKTTQPISRTSRLSAVPRRPPGNSSSSRAMVEGIPSTMAMPSPVSVTRPTSSRVTVGRNDSTCFLRAAAMSSGLMLSCSVISLVLPLVLLPERLDDAERLAAGAGDHRAQNSLVDRDPQLDRRAGDAGERLGQVGPSFVIQLDGAAHLGHHQPAAPGGQLGQLPGRGVQVVALAQLDQQVGEGGGAPAGAPLQQVGDQRALVLDRQAGVGEGRPQPGLVVDQARQLVELVPDPLQLAGAAGGSERGHRGQLTDQAWELARRHPLQGGEGGEQLHARLVQAAPAEVLQQGTLGLRRQAGVAQRLAQPHLGDEQAGEDDQV